MLMFHILATYLDLSFHFIHFILRKLQASLSEMIPPGCLVMLTPVVVGVLFGTRTLAGVLAGALVSGVQMAVSMSNTGGAWDNAKKYVEVRGKLHSPAQSVHMCSSLLWTRIHCCLGV